MTNEKVLVKQEPRLRSMTTNNTNSTGWIYDISRPANEDRPYKAFIIWGTVFLIVVLFGYELTKQITIYAFLKLPVGSYIYTSEDFMDAVVNLIRIPTIFILLIAAGTCLEIAKMPGKKISYLVRLLLMVSGGTYLLVSGWNRWQEAITSLPDPSVNASQSWIAVGLFSEVAGFIIAVIAGVFLAKLSCHILMRNAEAPTP